MIKKKNRLLFKKLHLQAVNPEIYKEVSGDWRTDFEDWLGKIDGKNT